MVSLNKNLRKGKFAISSGDIFSVPLSNRTGYFQFLYKDDNYMAGHVIRAFEFSTQGYENIDLEGIANFPIKFITYTRVFEGLEEGLWLKVGNIPIEQNFSYPVFRQTNDIYSLVKKSYNWFIWQFDPNNRKTIGELTDEHKQLPFSSIMPPSAIVEWLETGWHGYMRPE